MKNEMYKKVFINGVSDLPKESGWFIVHFKEENELGQFHYEIDKSTTIIEDHDYWLDSIDWYLQPLPSSDNVKSAELDDLKQYVTNLLYAASIKTDFPDFNKWVEEKTNELEEYYSQLPNKEGCSHVLGAADESGKCFKCGETVSITTRYEKREG